MSEVLIGDNGGNTFMLLPTTYLTEASKQSCYGDRLTPPLQHDCTISTPSAFVLTMRWRTTSLVTVSVRNDLKTCKYRQHLHHKYVNNGLYYDVWTNKNSYMEPLNVQTFIISITTQSSQTHHSKIVLK